MSFRPPGVMLGPPWWAEELLDGGRPAPPRSVPGRGLVCCLSCPAARCAECPVLQAEEAERIARYGARPRPRRRRRAWRRRRGHGARRGVIDLFPELSWRP